MPGVTGLGHLGLTVRDLPKMMDFYSRVLGFTITDGGAPESRGVFLSANPESEHHEIVLGIAEEPTNAQQISFTVGSLADLKQLHRAVAAEGCTIRSVVNEGVAVGFYFEDPENNVLEVYWPTGIAYAGPIAEPIDLEQSEEALLRLVDGGRLAGGTEASPA